MTRKKRDFWASCNAYWLEEKLNLKTCPYCNRNYITVIPLGVHRMRTDLDHFLPKSFYPYFSVSLHNLVPACKVCNSSQKGAKDFKEGTLSPYEFALRDRASFRYDPKRRRITFREAENGGTDTADLVQEYNDMFGIEEIYQSHLDLAGNYFEKYQKYRYFKNITLQDKREQQFYLSKEDQYKLLLGTVPGKEQILEESLGLLKRNMIKQFWGEKVLGMIEENKE